MTYPLVVTFVVVVTANHWRFDAVAGAAVAAVPRSPRSGFARTRPAAWAWAPASRPAPG